MSSTSRNPLATVSCNDTQYQLFTYQSGGESCMGLLLHEYSCNSFVAMIAKDLDIPL